MSRSPSVPVLMYHTVGRPIPDWKWSFLTVPARVFESHLQALRRAGYRTATLAELYDHVAGAKLLSEKTVVLTFDDGYVDNWTFAAPLLRKYGFTATVFVNPEFVDPRDVVRQTLDDVWRGGAREADLETRGFLSWPELRLLSESGVFSVQSHLMTHTWYPVGDEVVDFHHPGDDYFWLDWNANPSGKPFYLASPCETRVPWGTPVYRNAKSLAATRYSPDEAEAAALVDYVLQRGGEAFFRVSDWKERLFAEVSRLRAKGRGEGGRRETEAERAARVAWELRESKSAIEANLGVRVEFMAWPGGGYDDASVQAALEVYRSVTLSSRDPVQARNLPGGDPRRVRRLGVPYVEWKSRVHYTGGRYLLLTLQEHQGDRAARRKRQFLKLCYLARLAAS